MAGCRYQPFGGGTPVTNNPPQTVSFPTFPSGGWIQIPKGTFTKISFYRIYDDSDNDVTESFEARRAGNDIELRTLITYNNLTVDVFGD